MEIQLAMAASIVGRGTKIRGYNIAQGKHILLTRGAESQKAIQKNLDSITKQHGDVKLQLFLTVGEKDTYEEQEFRWDGEKAVRT